MWIGAQGELEAVDPSFRVAVSSDVRVGSRVRVGDGVTPAFGWGRVAAGDHGTVVGSLGAKVLVDFPRQLMWVAQREEVTVVSVTAEDARPGVRVRVRASVEAPSGGWTAGVNHNSVGVVLGVDGMQLRVAFNGGVTTQLAMVRTRMLALRACECPRVWAKLTRVRWCPERSGVRARRERVRVRCSPRPVARGCAQVQVGPRQPLHDRPGAGWET